MYHWTSSKDCDRAEIAERTENVFNPQILNLSPPFQMKSSILTEEQIAGVDPTESKLRYADV
jgi:hypothetical protein